ncbi:hypothetical protein ACJX0J_024268, partial [Zea mays]
TEQGQQIRENHILVTALVKHDYFAPRHFLFQESAFTHFFPYNSASAILLFQRIDGVETIINISVANHSFTPIYKRINNTNLDFKIMFIDPKKNVTSG